MFDIGLLPSPTASVKSPGCRYALTLGGLGHSIRKIQLDSVRYGAGSRPQSGPC